MKVSILIGTRNRIHPLLECLQSVLEQNYYNLEVLVLDDCSSNLNIERLVKEKFQDSRLRFFRSEVVLGVAGGRNFLMGQAKGDVLCVIDDDAVMDNQNCIEEIMNYFLNKPAVGILALKVIDYTNNVPQLLVPFSRKWRKKRPYLEETTQRVSYYLGGFHAIRREVIDDCGGYYEGLVFGEEEMDLAYRSLEAGFEIHYLPYVIAHHYPATSVIDSNRSTSELYHHVKNRFYLAYKYLPVVFIPVYLFFWLVVYARAAYKHRVLREYVEGIKEGIRQCRSIQRSPLSAKSVDYLKRNYGRLLY